MIKPTIGRVVWYRSPEWPNLLSHQEVLEAIDDAQRCMRAEIAQKGQQVAALEARNKELESALRKCERCLTELYPAEPLRPDYTDEQLVVNRVINAARAALKGA